MRMFFVITLVFGFISCGTLFVSTTEMTYERVAETEGQQDEGIDDLIDPYRKQFSAVMDEEIGILEVDLTKESPESDIGNWLADMLYEEVKTLNDGELDFAVQNQGGIRVTGMRAGPITIGEIFEVMPFDNMVSIMSADSAGVMEFIHHMAKGRGWPISKELTFKIKEKRAIEVLLLGEPLEGGRTYHFAVPDYVAGGGSGSEMLKELKRKDLDVLIRDTFIDNIKKDTEKGISQKPVKEGRIINLDHNE